MPHPNPARRKTDPKPVTFTPQQQAIVDMLIDQRMTTGEIAKSLDKDPSYVSRTIHLPKVQDLLVKHVASQRGTAAMIGFNAVTKLAETGRSEFVRLEAGKDLLNRAGFVAPNEERQEGEVTIRIDLS